MLEKGAGHIRKVQTNQRSATKRPWMYLTTQYVEYGTELKLVLMSRV